MNYNIKGTGVVVSDELRTYVEKKLTILEKFVGERTAPRADVELEYKETGDKKFRAEFTLHDTGLSPMPRAESSASTLHEAIDFCEAELFSELTRDKKKRRHVFRHTAVAVKEYLRGWRSKI